MFPIRDHNPSRRVPYVTVALLAINIVVFLSYAQLFGAPYELGQFMDRWGLVPASVSAGENWHGLITSMFLHGGVMHLAGNMLFLWIYGDNLEDELGHLGFLAFYTCCGLVAGGIQIISAPWSPIPIVGASGAIAGVMGGYLLLFPKARVDILLFLVVFIRIFPIPAWIVLSLWFAMQFIGLAGADPSTGGVAYWAHIGGFVAGLLLIVPVWLKEGGRQFWTRTNYQPPHPEARYKYSESRVPKIRRN